MKRLFFIFVLGAILTACSIEKKHKTENQMEPKILAIGRLQSTLDVLVEEWERYGRNVIASNSKDRIKEIIETESIDFICIGGGLPDNEREEMESISLILTPKYQFTQYQELRKPWDHITLFLS